MCDSENPTTPPNSAEIQDALESAEQLRQEVDHYRSVAQRMDDEAQRANEDRHLSLEDLPYGEELIRTRDLPENISNVITTLERLSEGQIPGTDSPQIFEEVLEVVEEARSTLDDCRALPTEDEDEDEDNV